MSGFSFDRCSCGRLNIHGATCVCESEPRHDGTRALSSVIECQTMRMRGTGHPTEKPTGILEPLITYSCPEGGMVLDPFAGSGSTGAAAKALGRRAVLIEADERYCEIAARRLAQDVLPFEEAGC